MILCGCVVLAMKTAGIQHATVKTACESDPTCTGTPEDGDDVGVLLGDERCTGYVSRALGIALHVDEI
jgi:hypothetical protein